MTTNDPFRVFPKATEQERQQLRASIEAVGLRNPLVIDEHRNVIDGHERRDICDDLGIDWYAGADVQIGLTDDQKKSLAIERNLWRRPLRLTRRQRNELIDIYLIANPQLSEPQVAELFGVNQSTINRRKRTLMQTHKLPPVTMTVGKDGIERKVGQRRGSRLIVKSKKEYDSLLPDLREVAGELGGIVRRPKRFHSVARRKRKLAEVSEVTELPSHIELKCCDFRNLVVEPESVDLVLTDVVWSNKSQQDWRDLAVRAANWMKPEGIFVTIIGQQSMFSFVDAVRDHLSPIQIIALRFPEPRRNWATGMIQMWRPALVCQRLGQDQVVSKCPDMIDVLPFQKDYDEWEQSVDVSIELVQRLSEPGALIIDPQVGTGTNALGVSSVGQGRHFIGCDIAAKKVRIARHRVATEAA